MGERRGRGQESAALLNGAVFITTMGSASTQLGFMTYVLRQTQSALDTGGVMLITLLVGMVLGPFLGLYVKRQKFMHSMVWPEMISGVLILVFLLFKRVDIIYAVAFFIGINNKVLGIARMSFVPFIAGDLVKFNAMLRSINRVAMICGALLFSALVNVSLDALFFVDAVTYFISAYLLFLLNKRVQAGKDKNEEAVSVVQQLLEGYKLLFLDVRLRYVVMLGILARVFYAVIPIMLLILIKKECMWHESIYGYAQAISRAMSFLAFVFVVRYVKKDILKYFMPLVVTCMVLYGIFIGSIGFVTTPLSLYLLYGISEICLFSGVVLVHAYVQEALSKHEIAIASGSVSTGFSMGSILSIVVFTTWNEVWPASLIFHICGIGLVLSALFVASYRYMSLRAK